MSGVAPAVELVDVGKTYRTGSLEVAALRDVSLRDRATASSSPSSGRPGRASRR